MNTLLTVTGYLTVTAGFFLAGAETHYIYSIPLFVVGGAITVCGLSATKKI